MREFLTYALHLAKKGKDDVANSFGNYKLLDPTQIKFCLLKFIFAWKPHDTVEWSCEIQQGFMVF